MLICASAVLTFTIVGNVAGSMPNAASEEPLKPSAARLICCASKVPVPVTQHSGVLSTVSTCPRTIRSFWITSNCWRLCFSPRAIASSRLSGSAPGVGRSTTTPPGSFVVIFGTGAWGRSPLSCVLLCVPPCAPADATSPQQTTAATHTPILVDQLPNESVILFSIRVFCPPQVANSSEPKLKKISYLGHQTAKIIKYR